jgi:hypothetical protein
MDQYFPGGGLRHRQLAVFEVGFLDHARRSCGEEKLAVDIVHAGVNVLV